MNNYMPTNQQLEEMDILFETYNLPRLNHEQIVNLNITNISKEIKSVTKNIQTKVQYQTASMVNYAKHSKEN